MILPNKYLRLSDSIFGLSGCVLKYLDTAKSIDEIWDEYKTDCKKDTSLSQHSFVNIILAVDFLFSLCLITGAQAGRIKLCD